MERFKALDPNLPERIVRMAERSFDRADRELDIAEKEIDTANRELDIVAETQRKDLSIKQHEAETKRITVEKSAKYDFRAQMIIMLMVIILLSVTIFLALNEQAMVACFVATGGFGAIITAAIKGVSGKTK
jgi:uncharacterized membrane protein